MTSSMLSEFEVYSYGLEGAMSQRNSLQGVEEIVLIALFAQA